jgi:hypothetical protein
MEYAKSNIGTIIKANKRIDTNLYYFCAECNQEVYAVCKNIKQRPHFRHKNNTVALGCSCGDAEGYIHWVTKHLFVEHYKKVASFDIFLDISQTCNNKGLFVKLWTFYLLYQK